MKLFNKILFLLGIVLVIGACEKERAFTEFDDLEKGIFPRITEGPVGPYDGAFNFFDVSGSTFSYTVEIYDENEGQGIDKYEWAVSYSGAPDIGSKTVKTITDWTTNSNGLPSANFTFSFQEALDALGLTIDDVDGGEFFSYSATLTDKAGRSFTAQNTGSNVISSAPFSALFNHRANIICPSDLAGTYTTTTTGTSTDGCCPDETTVESQVTLTAAGGSNYVISDWSAGMYQTWYEIYGITDDYIAGGNLNGTLTDACGSISASIAEPFQTTTTVVGSVDEATGVITYTWTNGYDDTAVVILTPQ